MGSIHIQMWKPPMRGIMLGNKSSSLSFNENIALSIFLYIAWLALMKIKFALSSFIMFSVRLITAAVTFKSVGGNGKCVRYPIFTLSTSWSETSSLNKLLLCRLFFFHLQEYISQFLQIHDLERSQAILE